MEAEIRPLGKVLAEKPVGVFIRSALSWTLGGVEVDRQPVIDPEVGMTCQRPWESPQYPGPQRLGVATLRRLIAFHGPHLSKSWDLRETRRVQRARFPPICARAG